LLKVLKSAMLAAGLAACAAVPSASAGGWYDGYYGGGYGRYYVVGYGGYYPYTSCCYERTVRYRRVYADPYYGGGYYGGYYPRHVYYDPYPYIARYGGYYGGGG
jgi:hypothetical protein